MNSFNVIAQNWNLENSFIGSPIDDGIGFSIGNAGYVGSGRDAGFQYKSEFYKFEKSSWEQIASIQGVPRQYATSFSFPNTGCIVNGLAPSDSILNEIQCYSTTNDEWHIKSAFPGTPRFQASSFTIGEIGYCGGGRNLLTDFNDWYKFDFLANTWTAIANFPDARNECISFSINGIGYVGLGRNSQGEFFNDCYYYNPLTNSWAEIASFPGGIRSYATSFAINGKAIVCTGSDDNYNLSSEVWSYDPKENEWSQLTDFPYPKIKGVSQFSINDCIHLVTGIDEQNIRQNVNYQYCEESSHDSDILIYPNPSHGNTVVLTKGANIITKIELIDLNGKTVLSITTTNNYNILNLQHLQKGVYILNTTLKKGISHIQKLIIL